MCLLVLGYIDTVVQRKHELNILASIDFMPQETHSSHVLTATVRLTALNRLHSGWKGYFVCCPLSPLLLLKDLQLHQRGIYASGRTFNLVIDEGLGSFLSVITGT